ncbi:MAG: succinylglutamate desuccinylase/aspartoacylase family protein [Armatimonadetes bacterium]|nr:succinylglutamate desuccinylase/aspartoacylase family protein [Armatimonadota bacterium]
MTTIAHTPIDGLRLAELPPGRHRRWLEILPTPDGVLSVPLLAVVGRRGPAVFAVAGVHGDEWEGPEAIWDVWHGLDPAALHGAFLAIPLCNPLAYAIASRTTPLMVDGLNLARVFPGDPEGLPTQRLAAALFALITRTLTPSDLFVDLHSGGTRYEFLPVVGYRRGLGDEARSRDASRAFGIPNLWLVEPHTGTFNTEIARTGIPTIGAEVLGGGGSRREDVAAYREGLLNALRFQGVLRDRPAPRVEAAFHETADFATPVSGLLRLNREVGAAAAAGDVVAQVLNPFGDVVAELAAPRAGHVWVMRRLRTVWAGDRVWTLAYPEA